ncbi:MAG: gliding motility-associated C-terminal domain-containing protein [Saprospiraceae bacterium]|nr:gliding motility-associated C-terminal domain-containing protein [Lewinella sp.]
MPAKHLWRKASFIPGFLIPFFFYFGFFSLPDATVAPPVTEPIELVMGCNGSLGENLFERGDFGSGTANIPSTDPQIAPGYTYAKQGPPSDGLYVITNYTGAWPNLYGSWIRIRDNSDDPNGYMMVVNASYEPGIFYQEEITGLCANTTFEFSADVINLISRSTANHIKPNISFYINDELKFTSGDIPQDETWKTYGFSFTTGTNETDLTLSIRNNAPGGTGNDLALDNISFRPCGPEAIVLPEPESFVCVDDNPLQLDARVLNSSFPENFVQWQISSDGGATFVDLPGETNFTYTITDFRSGVYYYRFLVAGTAENLQNVKCRVFSTPKKITVLPKFHTVSDTICNGLVYETNEGSYTQTGIYVDTLISSFGCDSIVTLNLTVIDDPRITADVIVDGPSCYNVNDASVNIMTGSSGYPPFLYLLNDDIQSTVPFFSSLAPGDYDLRIVDRYGCYYTEPIQIEYPPELTVDIGENTMIKLGLPYHFQPTVSYQDVNYQWTSPLSLSCTDCAQPSLIATANGNISLLVTNVAGCTATDSIYFSINTADSYHIYAPNVFSPNSDGINDRFTVFTNGFEAELIETFQVYDRWGSLLYDGSNILPGDISQGWDGRFKNQPVDMGVYIYRIDLLFIDGMKKTFTGSVTVIR